MSGHDHDHDHRPDRDHGHTHGPGHDHGPAHEEAWSCRGPGRERPGRAKERTRLWWAMVITAVTMVGEAIGGVLVGSLALVSDAGHMLTHAFALGISLAAIVLAARPTKAERTFGLHRLEILAALLNGFTLLAVTVWITWSAVLRFREPQPILETPMLVVAIVGLVVNLITAWLLHDVGKRDLNVRSAFLHMLGDTASSVAVVVGAIVIEQTDWLWIDPALSLGICVLILIWSAGLIRDAVRVLLEAAPYGMTIQNVRDGVAKAFPEVVALHDIHVWTVTSGMVAMTARVEVRLHSLDDCGCLAEKLEAFLRADYGIGHATLQFFRRPPSGP
jgi:cobalt-zinc-cadmium efflux system protein